MAGRKAGPRARVERLIGWQTPTSDWVKLNTDDESHGNPGLAYAGRVLTG